MLINPQSHLDQQTIINKIKELSKEDNYCNYSKSSLKKSLFYQSYVNCLNDKNSLKCNHGSQNLANINQQLKNNQSSLNNLVQDINVSESKESDSSSDSIQENEYQTTNIHLYNCTKINYQFQNYQIKIEGPSIQHKEDQKIQMEKESLYQLMSHFCAENIREAIKKNYLRDE